MTKLQVDTGNDDATNGDKAVAYAYKNHLYVPLDFELLESQMLFYQFWLFWRLSSNMR